MNIFDPVVPSSRAATAPASPNSWSGNCKATCKYKPQSKEQPLLHPLQEKPSRGPWLTFKAPPPRGATAPVHPRPILTKLSPYPDLLGNPFQGEPRLPNLPSPADTPGHGQIQRLSPARTRGAGPLEE